MSKPGANKGRKFFKCKDDKCKFFECDDQQSGGATFGANKKSKNNNDDTEGPNKRKFGVCGEEGSYFNLLFTYFLRFIYQTFL